MALGKTVLPQELTDPPAGASTSFVQITGCRVKPRTEPGIAFVLVTVAFDIDLVMVLGVGVYGMCDLVILSGSQMVGDVCALWGWMRNVADMRFGSR